MMLVISKNAVDIGIITRAATAMMEFYHELLGLELEAIVDMPGGGVMRRLRIGDSVLKIIDFDSGPDRVAVPGGIRAATGCRYWTVHVSNLDQVLIEIENAGHKIVLGRKTIREGVAIAIVEDPDGNCLEFVETR